MIYDLLERLAPAPCPLPPAPARCANRREEHEQEQARLKPTRPFSAFGIILFGPLPLTPAPTALCRALFFGCS
jgi:hypothetical protein